MCIIGVEAQGGFTCLYLSFFLSLIKLISSECNPVHAIIIFKMLHNNLNIKMVSLMYKHNVMHRICWQVHTFVIELSLALKCIQKEHSRTLNRNWSEFIQCQIRYYVSTATLNAFSHCILIEISFCVFDSYIRQ